MLQTLVSFGNEEKGAANPEAPVIVGSDGTLYGTTYKGGAKDVGAIFRVNHDGSGFRVMHSFGRTPADGAHPTANLLQARDGMLYGTTDHGGEWRCGTIFRLNPDGSDYEVLHAFYYRYENPANPTLIEGSDGNFYGTTSTGGTNETGSVFRLSSNGNGFEILHHFARFLAGGHAPRAKLLEASDGFLYGTTTDGSRTASIFKLAKDGSGFQVLHELELGWHGQPVSCSALIEGSGGALYGTMFGDATTEALLFRVDKESGNFRKLHEFASNESPIGLLAGPDRWLYGLTRFGGQQSGGSLFIIHESGRGFRTLRSFGRNSASGMPRDGAFPVGAPVETRNGRILIVTQSGGRTGMGTISEFDGRVSPMFAAPVRPDHWRTIWEFKRSGGACSMPNSRLALGPDGMWYGTTTAGGPSESGTVFRVAADGSSYKHLWSFSVETLGLFPTGVIVDPSSGALCGVTAGGGKYGFGVIFRLTPGGRYKVLHQFRGGAGDGRAPGGGLLLASDGHLYGATIYGGRNDSGTLFRIKPDGSGFSVIHHHYHLSGNGFYPPMTLVEGSDGSLFAACQTGSDFPSGQVFRFDKGGRDYTALKSFNGLPATGTLLRASDNKLYGVALMVAPLNVSGPFEPYWFIFRINQDGSDYEVARTFDMSDKPAAVPLVEREDGTLCGLTESGAFFQMNKDGSNFLRVPDLELKGASSLRPGPDGALYGTTITGGSLNQGTVFRLVDPRDQTGN